MGFFKTEVDPAEWERDNREVARLVQENQLEEALHQGTDLVLYTRKYYGKQHPRMATSLNNLGLIYLLREDHDRAESCFLNALEISEKVHGKNHSETALINRNLALLYSAKYRKIQEMQQDN
jgi:hypothetical protein